MIPEDTCHKAEATILGITLIIFTTPAIRKAFKIPEDPNIKQQIGRALRKGLKFYLTARNHLQIRLLKTFPQLGSREL